MAPGTTEKPDVSDTDRERYLRHDLIIGWHFQPNSREEKGRIMLRSGGSGPSDRAPARRGTSSRRRIGVIVQWPGDDRAQGGRRHSTRRHDVSQRRICRGTLIHKIPFS